MLDLCVDLDPPTDSKRRKSDGRSEWIEPTSPRFTSDAVLTQEEHIITWAIEAQIDPPAPSKTLDRTGLDVLQASAASAVAGDDRLVLVVGPAGAGKTRMLAAAVTDLDAQHRSVFGVAPTAKAARVLQRDTGMPAETVAKLLHEWHRPDRPPRPDYQLAAGTTVVVDEAGMLSTPALHHLVTLAESRRWRLVLVGDHRQLQAVGRGGLFAELCTNGRVEELERVHRFTHEWEAAATLKLRAGDPRVLDAYEAHDRMIPGTFDDHLSAIAETWIKRRQQGDTLAVVASTNDHVDSINQAVQRARVVAGHLNPNQVARIAGGEHAYIGDVVVTRRNDRTVLTTAGEPVRNRETWTVMAIGTDGSLTVTREHAHGSVELPADYVHQHVRLGYAATAHGYQSDTVDHSLALVSAATTRRGLYVAATRGRVDNLLCVVTDSDDVAEARDTLERILAYDRADIPAVTQRRTLAEQQPHQPHPRRTPRCEMPAWFEPLRAELRGQLAVAEQEAALSKSRGDQLVAAFVAAQRDLSRIDAATVPARDALAASTSRHEAAWRSHALAEKCLDGCRILGRRAARRHLTVAEADLERASEQLRIARQHTGPDIDRYSQAMARLAAANDDLRRYNQRARLRHTFDQLPHLRQQVEAVDTWGRWARGDAVAVHQLNNTVTLLTSVGRRHEHADRFRELGQAIRGWADHNDFELPIPARQTRQANGLEIGF